ncbi:hypothetical protein FNV43_RR13800 [Rhamnella rubrinervis]|uniref:Uncharacterized protein n=1 Tax=Rhamnella rubrinervis TaxID=2594499 RepID=A0A8K0MFN0_9ROSA|nr:hypothetical protein FNV43_RR13800 [Rhamnella rubrinervis]
MKILYSKLNSLLPTHSSRESLALPDQIDEAINYIKTLEAKLKESEVKKESLLVGRKRSQRNLNLESTSTQIEIHEMGSALEVVLVSGSDNQFVFFEVLRIIQEEGADVISAKFSVSGDTTYNVINAEIGESMFIFGAAKITERLKRFVSGSSSDLELQPELWDFEAWDF